MQLPCPDYVKSTLCNTITTEDQQLCFTSQSLNNKCSLLHPRKTKNTFFSGWCCVPVAFFHIGCFLLCGGPFRRVSRNS